MRFFRILNVFVVVGLIAGCAKKQPGPLSHYQDLPTMSGSELKTNPIYKDVLESEYRNLHEEDELSTKNLEEALKKDPKSEYLRTRLAYQYARTEKIPDAMIILEQVIFENPKNLDALFLHARVLAVKGEFEKSKVVFLQILDLNEIKQDPDQKLEVSFILATVYIEKGELGRAEEILKGIIAENPEHILSYYYLGRVYSEQSNMKLALSTYQKAVEIDPRFTLSWRALGLIYEYMDQPDRAIEAYEKVVAIELMNVDLRTKLIDLYLKKNQTGKAIEQIAIIKKLYPNVPDVSVRLGLFYYQQKMYAEAESEFAETLKVFKTNTDLYYYLGLSQYQQKKKDAASENFSKVTVESEMYPVAQLAHSTLLEDAGRGEKAEKVLSNALVKKPTSVDLRIGLSGYYIRHQQFDRAQKLLQEGVAAAPKEQRYLLSLAEIYEKQKQYADMEKTIHAVFAIDPNNASALNFLGYSYADRNIRLVEAETMVQKALAIKPHDGYIQDSLAWVYYQKKEFKKAEDIVRKALNEIPDEPIILEHLGYILLQQGKTKDAKEAFQKVLSLSKEPERKKNVEDQLKKLPR